MRRGEIWWASLAKRRPVVIVQSNFFNESQLNSLVVAAVTSNLRLAEMPGNVRLSSRDSGLSRPSVVNVTQLLTIRRERLTERVKALPPEIVRRIDEGVKLVLGLQI
jgi:mRNA interferase MazF